MKFLKAAGLLALCAGFALGQEFSSLTAHVQDSSGAAIVGATVDASNLDTSSKRSAITDGTGTATFVQMTPGRYKVSATMAGFSTATVDNVALVVNTPA